MDIASIKVVSKLEDGLLTIVVTNDSLNMVAMTLSQSSISCKVVGGQRHLDDEWLIW